MDVIEDTKGFVEDHRALEAARQAHEAATQKRQTKLEMVRLAKEVLAENARNQHTDYSPVTAVEIIGFAEELVQYIGD